MNKNLSRALLALPIVALTGCVIDHDREVLRSRSDFILGPHSPSPGMPHEIPRDSEIRRAASLPLYLRYGLHHSAALRATFEKFRAAMERIPQAEAFPDPMFSFAHFIEEIQTRTGPQERRYGLSQRFPWFGKRRLRGEVARSAADEIWHDVERKRFEVARDIEVAFHDYAYLTESTRITKSVLDLLHQLEPVVQRRIAAGSAGQNDLLRLQVEIGRVENDFASLTKIRPSLSARLAAAMNWSDPGVLPLPKLAEPEMPSLEVTALWKGVEAWNPEMQKWRGRIERSDSAAKLAELDRWPDLTLGVDYFETDDALTPTRGSGDDPVAVRVQFNLPLWGSKYRAAEREADRMAASARYALHDVALRLRSDLEHAVFRIGDAARQVELYKKTLLPRARQSLEVTRSAYRTGKASLLDLMDSERTLLTFETGYWRACRDQLQSEARLRALIGDPIR